jgi:hypothetical protein
MLPSNYNWEIQSGLALHLYELLQLDPGLLQGDSAETGRLLTR